MEVDTLFISMRLFREVQSIVRERMWEDGEKRGGQHGGDKEGVDGVLKASSIMQNGG